jgi:phage-related protein
VNISKQIKIILLKPAEEYFNKLNIKIQDKFLISFDKTQMGFKGNWFTPIKPSDNIWEFRQRDSDFFYRFLAFWEDHNHNQTFIILTHGFNKKTNSTPRKEIRYAEKIKQETQLNLKINEKRNKS